jgi:hypothetical protein
MRSSPTIKIYKKGDGIVVSVRGTDPTDKDDLVADFASVKGSVVETSRYKKDEMFLRKFQEDYPTTKFRYTAVGHSLGGAIIDEFLRAGLVQNALSFNPMIQPQDRGGSKVHRRLYNNLDPLYLMFGKGVPNVEVRNPKDPLWLAWAKFKLPKGLRELFVAYDAHRLQSFRGGDIGDAVEGLYPPNITETQTQVVSKMVDEEVDEEEKRLVVVGDVPRARQKTLTVPVNAIAIHPDFDPKSAGKKGADGKVIPKWIFDERGPVLLNPDGKVATANLITHKTLFPVKEVEFRVVKTRRKTGKKIPVEEEVEVEVDTTPMVRKQLESIEGSLRTLAHFYSYRDPAASLGFRVVADEIHDRLTAKYKKKWRGKAVEEREAKRHADAREFTTRAILGFPRNKRYTAPEPRERVEVEVEPFFPLTNTTETDPKNPMYGAPPTSQYDIPPRYDSEREMMLQDYPNVKGKTLYMNANTTRVIPPDPRFITR